MAHTNSGFGKWAALLASAALALSGAVVAPAQASGCTDGDNSVELDTLQVSLRAAESVYRVGDMAKVKVRVQRTVEEQRQPAEGVDVAVTLQVRDVSLFGSGVTDHHGLATVKVKLKSYTPTGSADAWVFASKHYAEDLPCHLGPQEKGSAEVEDLFLVRPAD